MGHRSEKHRARGDPLRRSGQKTRVGACSTKASFEVREGKSSARASKPSRDSKGAQGLGAEIGGADCGVGE